VTCVYPLWPFVLFELMEGGIAVCSVSVCGNICKWRLATVVWCYNEGTVDGPSRGLEIGRLVQMDAETTESDSCVCVLCAAAGNDEMLEFKMSKKVDKISDYVTHTAWAKNLHGPAAQSTPA
jgi:hypothetical protein